MKDTKMKFKTISAMAIMLTALTLSACSHEPVPDDVREISAEEKKGIINAQTMPETTEAPTVKPSMGPGLTGPAPVQTKDPIDKGTIIMVPTVNEVTVEKNEKVKVYAGQLKEGTTVTAELFYSSGLQNDLTIDLGEEVVGPTGEVTKEVTIPENLASGNYVISLTIDGSLYTAPVKVG